MEKDILGKKQIKENCVAILRYQQLIQKEDRDGLNLGKLKKQCGRNAEIQLKLEFRHSNAHVNFLVLNYVSRQCKIFTLVETVKRYCICNFSVNLKSFPNKNCVKTYKNYSIWIKDL